MIAQPKQIEAVYQSLPRGDRANMRHGTPRPAPSRRFPRVVVLDARNGAPLPGVRLAPGLLA
jgi:hypothetical protein